MMVTLCEPVDALLKDLWAQASEVVGPHLTQVPATGESSHVRRSLEALGVADAPSGVGPHLLFVHARGVGGATPETETWLSHLAGFDLAVLYSEAWERPEGQVEVIGPGRWKAGTRVVRTNLRSFLDQARASRGPQELAPSELARGSWETLLQEPVLELLGLLLPATVAQDWRPSGEHERRCYEAGERLVTLVRAAGASGAPHGWSQAGGVLSHLRAHASARSQADALAVIIEESLGTGRTLPVKQRRAAFEALRCDLLRLLLPAVPTEGA